MAETPWPYLTSPTGTIPNAPTPEGLLLGAEFARMTEAALGERQDARCAECAFRAGTAANGCAGTLMDALKCLMEGEEFFCHMPGRENVLCAGYVAARDAGE